MSLQKEAAYLYKYSREFAKGNKRIKKLSKKSKEHDDKPSKEIKKLVKEHKKTWKRIHYHYIEFSKELRKRR